MGLDFSGEAAALCRSRECFMYAGVSDIYSDRRSGSVV